MYRSFWNCGSGAADGMGFMAKDGNVSQKEQSQGKVVVSRSLGREPARGLGHRTQDTAHPEVACGPSRGPFQKTGQHEPQIASQLPCNQQQCVSAPQEWLPSHAPPTGSTPSCACCTEAPSATTSPHRKQEGRAVSATATAAQLAGPALS